MKSLVKLRELLNVKFMELILLFTNVNIAVTKQASSVGELLISVVTAMKSKKKIQNLNFQNLKSCHNVEELRSVL